MSRYEYDPDGTAYSQGRRDGHAAGFAAALDMLREPSDELAEKVGVALKDYLTRGYRDIDRGDVALRAAASALVEKEDEDAQE